MVLIDAFFFHKGKHTRKQNRMTHKIDNKNSKIIETEKISRNYGLNRNC